MWTPTALASEAKRLQGVVWRVVEHQHTTSTRKIVDTLAEQDVLEAILEGSKPAYPPDCERLHYLLKTPFRYRPARVRGSRFRRPGARAGVFYASEHIRTALAEMAYYRVKFFQASPATPLPRNEERLTAFTVRYHSSRGLNLMAPPLDRDRRAWTNPNDYSATHALADAAREAKVDAIRYESVRDPEPACANLALLTPRAFAHPAPLTQETWLLYIARTEVSCTRAGDGDQRWVFPR